MVFGDALQFMKLGMAVKRPTWTGYWKLDGDTLNMHCKDGRVLSLKDSENELYTMENMAADDWEVTTQVNFTPVHTFSFGEAVRKMKDGKKVARLGWNGKGMWVVYRTGYPNGIACNKNTAEAFGIPEGSVVKIRPYLQMFCADGTFQMWFATQSDILANDWMVVE